jgi:hypothetical protein
MLWCTRRVGPEAALDDACSNAARGGRAAYAWRENLEAR